MLRSFRRWIVPSIVVALLAGAPAPARTAVAAEPPADLTGTHVGHLSYRTVPLDLEARPERGRVEVTIDLVQDGAALSGTLAFTDDEGVHVFELVGRYGNGRLWLLAESEDGRFLLAGVAKARSGESRLALTGRFVNDEEIVEVKGRTRSTPTQI